MKNDTAGCREELPGRPPVERVGEVSAPVVFINLTNHPSSGWSQEQLQAALQYGPMVDLPFPDIPPGLSTAAVGELADAVAAKICSLDIVPVVHVMGETTFTYAVVSRLQASGITCLASTTVRDSVMAPGGKKVSTFRFVQFREYPR